MELNGGIRDGGRAMKTRNLACGALCGLLLVACHTARVTHGADFTETNLTRFEVGKTTFDQVKAYLGTSPRGSTVREDGLTLHRWQFIHAEAGAFRGVRSTGKTVSLLFDRNDIFVGIAMLHGFDLTTEERRRLMYRQPGQWQQTQTPEQQTQTPEAATGDERPAPSNASDTSDTSDTRSKP
jgi:hypothetical protein